MDIDYDIFNVGDKTTHKVKQKAISKLKRPSASFRTDCIAPITIKMFHLEKGNWTELDFVGHLTVHFSSVQNPNLTTEIFTQQDELVKAQLQSKQLLKLKVINSENGSLVMTHLASCAIDYQKDGDTIITWAEGEEEIAISFAKKSSCDEVLRLLKAVDVYSRIDPNEIVSRNVKESSAKSVQTNLAERKEDSLSAMSDDVNEKITEGKKEIPFGPNDQNVSMEIGYYDDDNDYVDMLQRTDENRIETNRNVIENNNMTFAPQNQTTLLNAKSLDCIDEILNEAMPPNSSFPSNKFLMSFGHDEFIEDLSNVFKKMEDFGDINGTAKIFKVVKSALLSNRFTHILTDRFIDFVIAALEYSPEDVSHAKKAGKDQCFTHRTHLKLAKMKTAPIEITPEAIRRIDHLQKLFLVRDYFVYHPENTDEFMRDLRCAITDQQGNLLFNLFKDGSMENFLKALLVSAKAFVDVSDSFSYDNKKLSLSESDTSEKNVDLKAVTVVGLEGLRDQIEFLEEMMAILKQLPILSRKIVSDIIFKDFTLFATLEALLQAANPKDSEWLWIKALEMLDTILMERNVPFKAFVEGFADKRWMKDDPSPPIISRLFDVVADWKNGMDPFLRQQVVQFLSRLITIDSIEPFPNSKLMHRIAVSELPKLLRTIDAICKLKTDQIGTFKADYDKCADQLKDNKSLKLDYELEVVYQSLELVCSFARGGAVEEKIALLGRAVFSALPMLNVEQPKLALGIVRLLKVCLELESAKLVNSLLLNDCVHKLVRLLEGNGERRDNILSAAVLEFFYFVLRTPVKAILNHVRRDYKRLRSYPSVVFRKIFRESVEKDRTESEVESQEQKGNLNVKQFGKLDSEEIYFSKLDNEENLEPAINQPPDTDFIDRKTSPKESKKVDLCALSKTIEKSHGPKKIDQIVFRLKKSNNG